MSERFVYRNGWQCCAGCGRTGGIYTFIPDGDDWAPDSQEWPHDQADCPVCGGASAYTEDGSNEK